MDMVQTGPVNRDLCCIQWATSQGMARLQFVSPLMNDSRSVLDHTTE